MNNKITEQQANFMEQSCEMCMLIYICNYLHEGYCNIDSNEFIISLFESTNFLMGNKYSFYGETLLEKMRNNFLYDTLMN